MNTDSNQPGPDPQPDQRGDASPMSAAAGPAPNEQPADAWFDGEGEGEKTEPRSAARPRSTRSWIAGGVTAVAIAAGAMFGINAVSSHSASSSAQTMQAGGGPGQGGRGMGTQGTITAVNGSTITVKTASGTTKVATGSSTTVSLAKTGTVSDIAAGDHVMVMGTTSGTNSTATRIVDQGKTGSTSSARAAAAGGQPPGIPAGGQAPPGGAGGTPPSGAGGRPVDGIVTKVSGSTITVKGTDGTTYTVSTGSSTEVTVESTGSLSDLAAGDTVQVMGQPSTSGTVTAIRIVEGAILDDAPTGSGAGST